MIIPRGLIFKTLLGVVAAGGIITPTVVFKKEISDLFNGKSEEDSVVENGENSDGDINSGSNQGVNNRSSSQITGSPQTSDPVGSGIPSGGPTKQDDDVDVLGIPNNCTTCKLTSDQLKNLKFEPKSGFTITIDGLSGNDTVELTVTSVTNDSANYPKGKKYTLKSTTGTVTIKGVGGGDIVLEKNKGVDFREKKDGVQLEKVAEDKKPQVTTTDSLGLPTSCKSDQVAKSGDKQICELTVEDLKKVKFKDLDDSGTATVSGLNTASNKITLTISWDDDNSTYPGNKKYIFDNSSNKNDVKITKDKQEVKIAQKTESWFKDEGNKLSLVKTKLKEEKNKKMNEVNEELEKLGLSDLKLTEKDFKKADSVGFEQKKKALDKGAMKKIQFSELGGAPTDISDWDDKNKIELEFDYTSVPVYQKNMKFTFKNTSGKDITIKKDKKSLKFKNGESETFKVVNSKLIRAYYMGS